MTSCYYAKQSKHVLKDYVAAIELKIGQVFKTKVLFLKLKQVNCWRFYVEILNKSIFYKYTNNMSKTKLVKNAKFGWFNYRLHLNEIENLSLDHKTFLIVNLHMWKIWKLFSDINRGL